MRTKRVRQPLPSVWNPDIIDERHRDGWRAIAIEWERVEEQDESPESEPEKQYPVPYGLRISADGLHLAEQRLEQETMETTLALIAADKPLSEIAERLNERGFRTRSGSDWTQVSLFRLLPRLIETAPEVFRSEQWSELRLSAK